MISFKHKFIFIHAPKTAGNSIQNVLLKYSDDEVVNARYNGDVLDRFGVQNFAGGKHATMSHYIRHWDQSKYGKFEDYVKVGCVRNPWDRATSYHFWVGYTNFDYTKFSHSTSRLSPMCNYYCYNGKKMIDFEIRYESLQDDFDNFCKYINVKKEKLPFANVSAKKTKNYDEYYEECERCLDLVSEKYKEDIGVFGYENGRQL